MFNRSQNRIKPVLREIHLNLGTKLILFLLFVISLNTAQAQVAIPASGGNAKGIGGSASISVGQVVYTPIANANGSVNQGVQQPYEIFVVTALKEFSKISLNLSVYPNPATDYLVLKINTSISTDLQRFGYQILDATGKLLKSDKIESDETTIPMRDFVSATYFLKVIRLKGDTHTQEIKTFKIIKN